MSPRERYHTGRTAWMPRWRFNLLVFISRVLFVLMLAGIGWGIGILLFRLWSVFV